MKLFPHSAPITLDFSPRNAKSLLLLCLVLESGRKSGRTYAIGVILEASLLSFLLPGYPLGVEKLDEVSIFTSFSLEGRS
jgi:hypothetical protein